MDLRAVTGSSGAGERAQSRQDEKRRARPVPGAVRNEWERGRTKAPQ
jgi:hypothetical protein